MKVAVTGGTGYVGSHTVAALQQAGHEVRLLVRSPGKVPSALEPVGGDPDRVDVVVADLVDRTAVDRGLEGVDALVHAASVFSLDRRRRQEMERANHLGLRHVMDAALAADLDPIVHVSSTVALLRDGVDDDVLTPDSPPGDAPFPYAASKAEQERYVRGLQADGAPVVITYPGGVYGPHDPYTGESLLVIRGMAGRWFTFVHDSGLAVSDVRDVAAVHAAVLEPGRGPRRYLAAGRYAALPELVAAVAEATGRRLPTIRIPAAMAIGTGRLVDRLHGRDMAGRIAPGITAEGAWIAARRSRVDASATERDLDVTFRPLHETIGDQVAWMRQTGRL